MATTERSGRRVGRLSRHELDVDALRSAKVELDLALADYDLAATMAEGSVGRRMRVDEARRRVQLAIRFLREVADAG